jgi:hypothetical protein
MNFYVCTLLVSIMLPLAAGQQSTRPNDKSPLGINLGGITYYSSELVFVDIFKQSSPWISQAEGKGWGKGGPLNLTSDGWIKSLRPGQRAESLICIVKGHYPPGKYVCLYDGNGTIDFRFDAKVQTRSKGRAVLEVKPGDGGILVSITETDPNNPIRNIKVIMPGFEKSYTNQTFRPDFLKRWQKFKVIRFMDWMSTNNSKIKDWTDRPTTDMQTQGQKGTALEYMIQLANTLNADPWFCMPHLATDEYIKNFAAMVKENLKPNLKVYIEYTNEAWNGIFGQARYCAQKGKELNLSDNSYQAQLFYYSKRSVEIFKIWQQVFEDDTRLVRVLSSQSANPWTGMQVMTFEDAYKRADVLATAPYFGHSIGDPKQQDKNQNLSVEQVLDYCRTAIRENQKTIEQNVVNAKQHGLDLIAYEAGQHLVGYQGAENNEKLTALLHSANRHPHMKQLYLDYLNGWKMAGGKTMAIFSSTGIYSKWGSWGLLEYHDQDVKTAPKYQAVLDFIKQNPTWW